MKLTTRILNWLFPSKLTPLARTDKVLFGFYASDYAQPAEVAGFTDLHWESMLKGEALSSIATAARFTVVDVSPYLFNGFGRAHIVAPDAESRLRAFRARLEAAGLMQYVKVIYPIDEPNLTVASEIDVKWANVIARRVFPECQLAVIYSGVDELWRIEDYDLVGFDDYGPGSDIFNVTMLPWPPRSDYDRLAARLRPDQRIILVPGGFDPFRQDPAPFFAKAAQDGRIAMILAFLWMDLEEGGKTTLGIRHNGLAGAYEAEFHKKQKGI